MIEPQQHVLDRGEGTRDGPLDGRALPSGLKVGQDGQDAAVVVRALGHVQLGQQVPHVRLDRTAAMIALINTSALPVAVLVYGALLTALFVAVATAPASVASPPAAQPARA